MKLKAYAKSMVTKILNLMENVEKKKIYFCQLVDIFNLKILSSKIFHLFLQYSKYTSDVKGYQNSVAVFKHNNQMKNNVKSIDIFL